MYSWQTSNSHFEKIFLCVIVQHFENICKGSRRRFLLSCNQYFFHRSLNAPTPVEWCLSPGLPATCPQCFATRGRRTGKAIASIAAPFWGCPQWNRRKKAFHGAGLRWIVRPNRVPCNDVSMLQLKRKSLRLPDGLLTKVYKDIVNGYHNENCW